MLMALFFAIAGKEVWEAVALKNGALRGRTAELRRLFDDLVEMTRIEAGALIVRKEAIDLTDAVAAATPTSTADDYDAQKT